MYFPSGLHYLHCWGSGPKLLQGKLLFYIFIPPILFLFYFFDKIVHFTYFQAWVAKKTDPPSHLHQSNSSESCKVPLCEDSVEKEKERLQKESIKNSLRGKPIYNSGYSYLPIGASLTR